MKAIWIGCLIVVLATKSQAAPDITAFLNSGELIGSNLTAGTTGAVEWASSMTGTWYTTWSNLDAISVGDSGTIRVRVPLYYRLLDAIPPVIETTTTTTTDATTTLDTTTTSTTSTTGGGLGPLVAGDVAIIRMNATLDDFTVLALRDIDASLVLHWTDNGWLANNSFRTGEAAGTVDILTSTITAGSTFEVTGTGLSNSGDQIFLFSNTLAVPTLLFGIDWANTAGWDLESTTANSSSDPAVTGGGLIDTHTLSVGSADDWEYRGIQTGTAAELLLAISDSTNWVAVNASPWTNGVFDVTDAGVTTTSTTSTTTDTSSTTTTSSSSTTATPSANKLAFVGFNADGNDDFAVVALTDLPASTTFYFTDNEWNGQSVGGGGGFNTGEGVQTWNTGGAQINAGTVIAFNSVGDSNLTTVTMGTLGGSEMGLNASDESIFLYEGTTPTNPTALLAAIASDNTEATTFGSLTGSGLVTNLTAIVVDDDVDVAVYSGPRTGQSGVGYLPLIGDTVTNWITDEGANDQSTNGVPPDLPFDLTTFDQ